MAEDEKPSGPLRAFTGVIQQWQVLVTAVAAATALWFGFADQRRKELDLNRQAVAEARADETRDRFRQDPYNTLTEFQATFPDHAFCAALGLFIAESGRLRISALAPVDGGPGQTTLRRINDAIAARIEPVLAEAGTDPGALSSMIDAARGDGTTLDRCAFLSAPAGRLGGYAVGEDCRRMLDTYAQTECQVQTAATQLAAAVPAEPPPPRDAAPAAPPAMPGLTADLAAACGDPLPAVFLQIVDAAARPTADALRREMEVAGWQVRGVDFVENGSTSGDVRYYHAEQTACAEALAAALGDWAGTPFAAISLEGRYRNLPQSQLEIWLPATATPAPG